MCLGVLRVKVDGNVISLSVHSGELAELLRELADALDTGSVRVFELSFVCSGAAS